MCRALGRFYQEYINVKKTGIPLRRKYGNIFRDVFVRLASVKYVFYIFLPSFMTCRRSVKEKAFSFIYYCTVRMKSLTMFSGALHHLTHYKNNLAHLLAFKNLVIEFLNTKILVKIVQK